MAPFLSFVLNGAGQIYNGEIKKGVLFFFVSLLFSVLLVVGIILLGQAVLDSYNASVHFSSLVWMVALVTIAGLTLCLNGLWSIIDAYQVAKKNDHQGKGLS